MRIDATLISHCSNGVNQTVKTIGDRIEQLLRDFGRARYSGAPPYTQVEFTDMLTGVRSAPNGKYYRVSTNKSTVNRILTDKQELPYDLLFAICDMFDTDTEWILRGNVLEPEKIPVLEMEKIPNKFNTDEANDVGAMIDDMLPQTRRFLETIAAGLLEIDQRQHESNMRAAELLSAYITEMRNGDRQHAREYIQSTGFVGA